MAKTDGKAAKTVKLYAKLQITNETFSLGKISLEGTVRDLKNEIEFASGIPVHIQRVTYLDEAELYDEQTLRQLDMVNGGILRLKTRLEWKELVEAVASNDIEWVTSLPVTKDTKFRSPNFDYLLPKQKLGWITDCANTALYMAAHRGHKELCERLIALGADVNCRTKDNGRTPLHVAVANDHGDVIDMLLEKGADVEIEDEFGMDAMSIAAKYGNKQCERHLFMFSWQKRATNMKPRYLNPPMWPHQKYDSNLPPLWISGQVAQTYLLDLNNPQSEYSGTRFDAPRVTRREPQDFAKRVKPRKHFPPIKKEQLESDAMPGVHDDPNAQPQQKRKHKQQQQQQGAGTTGTGTGTGAGAGAGKFRSGQDTRRRKARDRNGSGAGLNDDAIFDFDESVFQKPNHKKNEAEDKNFRDVISRINLVLEKNKLAADMPPYEIWRLATTGGSGSELAAAQLQSHPDDRAVSGMLSEFSRLRVTEK